MNSNETHDETCIWDVLNPDSTPIFKFAEPGTVIRCATT